MITILIGCNSSNDHQAVQPTISETKDGYFIKELWENGFPIGIYVVNGYANFSVTDENGVEEQFTIKGQIEFEVIEHK